MKVTERLKFVYMRARTLINKRRQNHLTNQNLNINYLQLQSDLQHYDKTHGTAPWGIMSLNEDHSTGTHYSQECTLP